MYNKPIIIVAGEPNSIFAEIFFKLFKSKFISKYKRPIVIIVSKKHLLKQMKKFNYNFKINNVDEKSINKKILNNKKINVIDVNFKFKKVFNKISNKSKNYIKKSFEISFKLMNKKLAFGLINGPISKKHFLENKYPGVTEYIARKANCSKKEVMLIYNEKLSVSPITTHIPIRKVNKNISIDKIVKNVLTINKFYKNKLKIIPKIAVTGLNPHCESSDFASEEKKIIIPAIKKLQRKKINIQGPYPADTIFIKKNSDKFDVVVGMYHDQILAPIKSLYGFQPINITLGLPYVRISPDHGPNNYMLGKNLSDPTSLKNSLNFFKKIKS